MENIFHLLKDFLVILAFISINEIDKAMERDKFFDAEEAMKFGLIDKVITKREDI